MKTMRALSLFALLAGVVVLVSAQTPKLKTGKGSSNHDEYLTNEYRTRPRSAHIKGGKGKDKASTHRIESSTAGGHSGSGTLTSDVSGKRVHKPLTLTRKHK